MRDVFIIGVIVAVLFILVRVIISTPLMQEAFANRSAVINSHTDCPTGAQMYMYEGVPYCCSGTINADAIRAKDSCRPLTGRDLRGITFCTLGPTTTDARNCQEMRGDLMKAAGTTICPPNMPNYVQDRCCAGTNADHSVCMGSQCEVAKDSNPFKNPNSCQFLKAQSEDGACPRKFGPFTTAGQGAMTGITLYGCTDGGRNCYSDATLKRLKELGYDVAGLPSCSKQ